MSELRIGEDVGDVNDFPVKHGSADDRVAIDPHPKRQQVLQILSPEPIGRDRIEVVIAYPVYHRPIGATESGGRLDQRVEHRLQIEGRAADDLQHVGGRGLLLQRLASLPPRLVSLTLCFRKLAGPGFQLLLQSFD